MQLFALGVSVGLQNGLANVSLALNSVSSFQLAKLMSCPVIAVVEWVWLGNVLSFKRCCCLVVLVLSVGLAQGQDFAFSAQGCSVALLWCLPTAFNKCYYAKLLKRPDNTPDPLGTLFAVIPGSIVGGLLMSHLFDPPGLEQWVYEKTRWQIGWVLGQGLLLGFLLQLSSIAVIKHNSALTHTISGQFKSILILLGGFAMFGDRTSTLGVAASCVALTAMALYAVCALAEKKGKSDVTLRSTIVKNELGETIPMNKKHE